MQPDVSKYHLSGGNDDYQVYKSIFSYNENLIVSICYMCMCLEGGIFNLVLQKLEEYNTSLLTMISVKSIKSPGFVHLKMNANIFLSPSSYLPTFGVTTILCVSLPPPLVSVAEK